MSDRFEHELREELRREAQSARELKHSLTGRIRSAIHGEARRRIVDRVALAGTLLVFAGLVSVGVNQLRSISNSQSLGPTPAPTPAPVFGPLSCAPRSGGTPGRQVFIKAIRNIDTEVILEFLALPGEAPAVPTYELIPQASAEFATGRGESVKLKGSSGLKVVFPDLRLTEAQPAVSPVRIGIGKTVFQATQGDNPLIRDLGLLPDFSVGIGLSHPACFRVLELTRTPTLVIVFGGGPSPIPTWQASPSR